MNNALAKNTPNSSHLSNLNDAQLEAVVHKDGPLLVFAGAGSGKTRVLTRRVANLILEHQVHPSQILAVTFTNKAAGEMKSRVSSLLGMGGPHIARMWVSTFHSMCVRILRNYADELGFSKQFVIYDSTDSLAVMKRLYKKIGIDPRVLEPKTVLSRIDWAKNNFKDAESIRSDSYYQSDEAELMADLFQAYQEELLACNAMDFGDLLCNALSLLKLDKKIREQLQSQFRYILIDEYQDTNQVQYLLMKTLSEEHQNICAVGDDDQSIYAFRGASIDKILNFSKDYPDAKVVTLNTNYRSTKNILNAANKIIAKNQRRQAKTMVTDNEEGAKLVCYRAFDEKNEAQFILGEICRLKEDGAKLTDMAIFYRTNAQSRAIEEALIEAGFAYEIYGGYKFYERKEIKDIIAYFRLLLNPKDNESLLRVINTPARGIGQTTVAKLTKHASDNNISIYEALSQDATGSATGAAGKKLSSFFTLIEALKAEGTKATALLTDDNATQTEKINSVANLFKEIAEKTTYLQKLRDAKTEEADSRIENIEELLSVAVDYVAKHLETTGEYPNLEGFLDRASLSSDLDRSTEEADSNSGILSLMTLHLAKGLEFDHVFLAGLEEGLLPHSRSLESKTDLEEERRLCYVGVTRAKKQLFLSRATNRHTFGYNNWYAGLPSRFIGDIPEELANDKENSGFFEGY